MSASPLTAAELNDARRYCGYPVAAAVMSQPAEVQGASIVLDLTLAALTDVQVTTLRTVYLAALATIEAALPAASSGLDVSKAAVYERNKNELADRETLFASWREKLCYFLGVPFGVGLVPGAGGLAPAVFVV